VAAAAAAAGEAAAAAAAARNSPPPREDEGKEEEEEEEEEEEGARGRSPYRSPACILRVGRARPRREKESEIARLSRSLYTDHDRPPSLGTRVNTRSST